MFKALKAIFRPGMLAREVVKDQISIDLTIKLKRAVNNFLILAGPPQKVKIMHSTAKL